MSHSFGWSAGRCLLPGKHSLHSDKLISCTNNQAACEARKCPKSAGEAILKRDFRPTGETWQLWQPSQCIILVCLAPIVSIPSMLSVAEERGTVQVCATLTTPISIGAGVTVTLTTSDDTGTMLKHSTVHFQSASFAAAIALSAYVSVSMDVVFPAGTSNGGRQCIDVPIIDDSEMEGDETFTVVLTTLSSAVILGNAVTIITITDNDGECVCI